MNTENKNKTMLQSCIYNSEGTETADFSIMESVTEFCPLWKKNVGRDVNISHTFKWDKNRQLEKLIKSWWKVCWCGEIVGENSMVLASEFSLDEKKQGKLG